ncbi:MAG: hypothetical protein ACREH6_06440 [Geminicoccaceae bacterium]
MDLYRACIILHLLAASLWLGHMFVWSLFAMPALKRVQPAEAAEYLRERSLEMGGLGWPALIVLVPTGAYMLSARGIGVPELVSGAAFAAPGGTALALKLVLVACMIAYQALFGHRKATVAIHVNMLLALLLLAASVVLARGGA